jgi:hypothetical protein
VAALRPTLKTRTDLAQLPQFAPPKIFFWSESRGWLAQFCGFSSSIWL